MYITEPFRAASVARAGIFLLPCDGLCDMKKTGSAILCIVLFILAALPSKAADHFGGFILSGTRTTFVFNSGLFSPYRLFESESLNALSYGLQYKLESQHKLGYGLQTGLVFLSTGDILRASIPPLFMGTANINLEVNTRFSYLDIPVLPSIHFRHKNFCFALGGGVSIAALLNSAGNIKYNDPVSGNVINEPYDFSDNELNVWDWSWSSMGKISFLHKRTRYSLVISNRFSRRDIDFSNPLLAFVSATMKTWSVGISAEALLKVSPTKENGGDYSR